MNIFGIEINAQNVALAFTLVFLVFVLLNGLVGMARGGKKSVYYLIVSAVIFGLGFGLMAIAIQALLKMPIGKYVGGLVKSFYPEVTNTSSAEDIVLGAIIHQFPQFAEAVNAGSVTASFVMGLVSFVIKLVYIIVLLVLAFTLFKIIAGIIWLIIKPKKKDGVKPKKTFSGRMLGLGIGALKGAIYSLLIFALIAGVASVGSSAMAVANSASSNDTEAVLVLSDGNASLITLDANEGSGSPSMFGGLDMEFLTGIVGAYRQSAPGAIFGALKITSVPIDEFLFDGVFSFDVQTGDEVVNVKLRKEVQSVADAVAKVANQFDIQNVSLEAILNIGPEGEEALKGLVDAISDLSILKVAIPVALEVGMYSDILVDADGNKILGDLFTPDQIPDISKAIISDVKSIGYSLVDARKIVSVIIGDSEEEKNINTYLNLDPEVVKLLFDEDHLGGLSTIDMLAPIGITYLTTLEGLKQSIEEFGLSIEEITNMPEGATWSAEIGKLGDVYVAIQDLLKDPETGRVNINTEDYTSIIDLLTEEKVNNFVDTLFTSNIVNNSIGALVTFAREKLLPDEYKQYITIGEGTTFDATECKAFLNAATVLVKSGFLKLAGGEGIDISGLIESLDVDSLAKYLSQSTIVRSSLASSLDLILGNLSTGEMTLRFGTFEDWDDEKATEVELRSVLRAMQLLGKNLFNNDGENTGFSINTLKGLTEKELESILTSQIMRGTIVNFLVDNSGEGSTLSILGSGVNKVNANPDSWYDQYHLVESASLEGSNLTITPASKELDQEYNVDHFLVYCDGAYLTSVRVVAGENATVDLSKVVVGKDGSGNPIYHEPSNTKTYTAYGVNITRMGVERFSIDGDTLTINPAHLDLDNNINKVNKFNIYADGELIKTIRVSQSKVVNVDLSSIKVGEDELGNDVFFELKEDTEIKVYGYNEGELRKIFMAILSITSKLGDDDLDFSNTDNLTSMLAKVDDSDIENISYSVVINEALINAIEDLSKQDGAFIYIPQELKDGENKLDHDKWMEADETANILKAIKVVFNGGNVNADNLKIKPIIDNKDVILRSLIICETVKQNIVKVEGINVPINEGLDGGSLSNWKNEYDSDGNVTSRGEIDAMLTAITKVLNVTDDTSINNISADNLKLQSIITNRDEILKSKVISETIRVKLLDVNGIDIPAGEDLSTTDLAGWKNTYNADGTVATQGELSRILNAINYVLDINESTDISSISTDSIKIKAVIDNRNEILKSLVISETIRVKLVGVEGINIPAGEELSTTDLTGWKNTYNADGTVQKEAELSALLNAVSYAIAIDNDTKIDNISTDSIKLKPIVDHKDDILKSLVISETIRVKLLEVDGIDIPANEGLSTTNLTGWKNTYNADGTVATRAELSHLLEAVGAVLSITDSTTVNNIDTNAIKLQNVIDHKDDILKSLVISETIRKKLLGVDGINIPAGEDIAEDDLTGWKNTYNENDEVVTRAELSHLLGAVGLVLSIDENTTVNNISTDSIKLKPVIEEKDTILKSLVISETIRVKLLEVDGISIPAGEELSNDDLTGWKNTYNADGTVATRAELSHLLEAVGIVLNVTDETTVNNINTDSIKLKPVIEQRDKILKSLVISETIRVKLLEVEGIDVPTNEELSKTNLTGWKNTYNANGTVATRAELSHLLEAVGIVLNVTDETTVNNINTDSIKLKPVIEQRDKILKSLVISETIRKKLLEVDGIDVPNNEELSKTDLTGWKNTYNDADEVSTRRELSYLLEAVGIVLNVTDETTVNNIDTNDIKLKPVIEKRDKILKSLVISETIRKKLLEVDGIDVPANEGLSSTDLTGWKNTYNDAGEVSTRRELSYLLEAVGIILNVTDETTVNNINTNDIKLKPVIEQRDTILKSLVICGTVKTKLLAINDIEIPDGEGLSTTDLTGWKNTYNGSGEVSTHGEISKILYSIKYIISVDDDTTISSVNTNSIKLKAVIENDDEVLKSVVITNTIKTKLLAPSTGITVPADEGLSEENLTGWKNIYNEAEEVTTHGEVASLLESVNYILELDENTSIDTLNVSTIKLQRIITNRDDILRSVVIANTIKTKLLAVEGIDIPSDVGLSTTNLTGWKNIYDEEEALATRGELSHILGAIDKALDVDENTTLNSVNTNNIKVKKLITNRDSILVSLVLSETIRIKLKAISGISIPTNEGISSTTLEGWRNMYDENDDLTSHGEISRLLGAIDVMFEPTDETKIDGLDVNTISLKHIIDNSDDILKSLILADTIRVKVCAVGTGVVVPTDAGLSTTDLTGWKNIYNEDEYATSYGELTYLLKAIDEILHPTEETKLNNISVSIKMGDIIAGKVVILHSKVISETIKSKIVDAASTGTLKLPQNYGVSESPNYINWNNTYTDTYNAMTHVISYEVNVAGELDYLLASVGDLLDPADLDKEFNAIGALNYASLFDPLCQRDIISSKIISETIINRLEGVAALSIPNSTHVKLKDANDRRDWWNLDTGELIYFLNSIGSLLTDEQKSNLNSFNLDINSIYASLVDNDTRTTLLSSYVIADTLRANFYNLDSLKKPSVENAGVNLATDLDAWYLISNEREITHKELWNLIESIKLLLGDDFNESKELTLNDLLNNEAFIPTLDANKVNTNTTIHTFLASKLVEETFVQLAQGILTGEGAMANYIDAPAGGYIWYEYIYQTEFDPEDDDYEYDLQTILESLYQMNAAGLNYSAFSNPASLAATIASIDRAKLADAFVISRTFRGSIAKTFNSIFGSAYTAIYGAAAWDAVKFVQSDYDKPVTKAAASLALKTKIDTILAGLPF